MITCFHYPTITLQWKNRRLSYFIQVKGRKNSTIGNTVLHEVSSHWDSLGLEQRGSWRAFHFFCPPHRELGHPESRITPPILKSSSCTPLSLA